MIVFWLIELVWANVQKLACERTVTVTKDQERKKGGTAVKPGREGINWRSQARKMDIAANLQWNEWNNSEVAKAQLQRPSDEFTMMIMRKQGCKEGWNYGQASACGGWNDNPSTEQTLLQKTRQVEWNGRKAYSEDANGCGGVYKGVKRQQTQALGSGTVAMAS